MKGVYVVIAVMLLLSGCGLRDDDGLINAQWKEGKLSAVTTSTSEDKLIASVKGSIYGSGERVSVFGTCLNANDEEIPGTYGTLSAWYPNGSLSFYGTNMTAMGGGRFVYTGQMNVVQGTYLTEFVCHLNASNVTAKAFGEWQNPMWVSNITDTSALVGGVLREEIGPEFDSVVSVPYTNIPIQGVIVNFQRGVLHGVCLDQNVSGTASILVGRLADGNLSIDYFDIAMNQNKALYGNVRYDYYGVNNTERCPAYFTVTNNSGPSVTENGTAMGVYYAALPIVKTDNQRYGIDVEGYYYIVTIDSEPGNATHAFASGNVSRGSQYVKWITGVNGTFNHLIAWQTLAFSDYADIGGIEYTPYIPNVPSRSDLERLNTSMVAGFNQTQTMIANISSILNESFAYVASVANASVDRNDSYLAVLIRGIAVAVGAPITGDLNITVVGEIPTYYRKWRVEAHVLNEYGQTVGPPLVGCRLSTNNNPADVNVTMPFEDTIPTKVITPVLHEPYFYYEEKITVLGDFNYTVNCTYNALI